MAGPGAGGAVADGEDIVVARGLQRLAHHQLVDPVGLEAGDVLEHVRRLDAGRPHHELGRNEGAAGEPHAVGHDLLDLGAHVHPHLEAGQQLARRLGQALGQLRQDARRGLDQVDLDVHVGIDAVEAVGDELARRLVQLGRKLGARWRRRR